MKELRVGIIGLGVGEQHIMGCRGRARVAVLCDFSPDKLMEVAARHPGIRTTGDADEVLDDPDIDLVSIASFDEYHYRQVMRAIEMGKHVFVEKPLCLTRDQAVDIRRALAGKPGLRLSSNLILRRSRRFLQVKRLIGEGRLGNLYHLEADYNYGRIEKITHGWRSETDGYSVVLGGGVHMVDLLMWFAESDVVEVSAFGSRMATRGTAFRYDDCVVAIMKFASGATGKMAANFGCVHRHFHCVSVFGTDATFQNTLDGGRLILSRTPGATPEPVLEPYPGVQKGELLADFLESIPRGDETGIGERDVFKSMSVCFAIEESVRTGMSVAVKYI